MAWNNSKLFVPLTRSVCIASFETYQTSNDLELTSAEYLVTKYSANRPNSLSANRRKKKKGFWLTQCRREGNCNYPFIVECFYLFNAVEKMLVLFQLSAKSHISNLHRTTVQNSKPHLAQYLYIPQVWLAF